MFHFASAFSAQQHSSSVTMAKEILSVNLLAQKLYSWWKKHDSIEEVEEDNNNILVFVHVQTFHWNLRLPYFLMSCWCQLLVKCDFFPRLSYFFVIMIKYSSVVLILFWCFYVKMPILTNSKWSVKFTHRNVSHTNFIEHLLKYFRNGHSKIPFFSWNFCEFNFPCNYFIKAV